MLKFEAPKRKVFFSFHFDVDFWRTQQIRNIGSIERNTLVTSNKWEEIKKEGDKAIKNWIDSNLVGKSCLVVLVGESTASRKWVKYEIEQAWNLKKGVVGIRIHNLENQLGLQSNAGENPFDKFSLCDEKVKLSSVVKLKNPPQFTGKGVYNFISENICDWIEEAIDIRNTFRC
jgi:hypothetical protein